MKADHSIHNNTQLDPTLGQFSETHISASY
jgi:hypothetical protein